MTLSARGSRAGYLSDVAAVHFFTPLLHGDVTWGLHLLYHISSTSNAPGSFASHFKKLCCKTFQSWCCVWNRALTDSARVLRCCRLGVRAEWISKKNSRSKEKGGFVCLFVCFLAGTSLFLRSVVHVNSVWCAFSLHLLIAQPDGMHAVVQGELWHIGLLLPFIPRV